MCPWSPILLDLRLVRPSGWTRGTAGWFGRRSVRTQHAGNPGDERGGKDPAGRNQRVGHPAGPARRVERLLLAEGVQGNEQVEAVDERVEGGALIRWFDRPRCVRGEDSGADGEQGSEPRERKPRSA